MQSATRPSTRSNRANTLTALSRAPTAIKAAANCYCQLLVSQSDNNVKLIVLDRLAELKRDHRYVMQEMVMDILRALAAPNLDIRRKTLDVVLDQADRARALLGEVGG